MRWWKVLGLAGMAGVAATGVAIARAERRRTAYTADEVRARLHERLAAAAGPDPAEHRHRHAADSGRSTGDRRESGG